MNRMALTVAAGLIIAGCKGQASETRNESADILAVRNIEITFHVAGSVLPKKDLDLMMSIYADDAVLTDTAHDSKVYKGKSEVRAFFEQVAAPFRPENHYIGYTPAMRIKSNVSGDSATLYFECLWMDVDKNAIGSHAFTDMTLARAPGNTWLVKTVSVGKVATL